MAVAEPDNEPERRTSSWRADASSLLRPSSGSECCVTANPKPVPPYSRVVQALACLNCLEEVGQLVCRDASAFVLHLEAHEQPVILFSENFCEARRGGAFTSPDQLVHTIPCPASSTWVRLAARAAPGRVPASS